MNPLASKTKVTEKILCIQLKQIGDVLMTTPAVRSLAEAKPDREIHFLTQVPSNQILEFNPFVSKTVLYPPEQKFQQIRTLVKRLRREQYSIIIDFLGLPKTAVLSRLTGAPVRIGLKLRGRSPFYTHPVETPANPPYSAIQKSHLLSVLGIQSTNHDLDFFSSEHDHRVAETVYSELKVEKEDLIVCVSPVSRRDYKVWPARKFAEICDWLVETYSAQVLFLWGPGEYGFIKAVRDKMKHSSLGDYDIPTIRETLALLEKADLHIGNDNGPMHIAIAARTPTVAIFGRPMLKNWTPPNSKKHLGIEYDPGCKSACFYPKCGLECINKVSVASVAEMIQRQIKQIGSSR